MSRATSEIEREREREREIDDREKERDWERKRERARASTAERGETQVGTKRDVKAGCRNVPSQWHHQW